jgi:uncharacterized metal-binding protein YceD (DUF177 family)
MPGDVRRGTVGRLPAQAWRPFLPITAEFSRLLALDGVPPGGTVVRLQASAEECRALATRLELLRLDRLEGKAKVLRADPRTSVLVTGRLEAEVVQACVVTFEPVPATVVAEFDRLFSEDVPEETLDEVEIDPEAELPEPVVGGKLDLGEILAQELSLALDPYPRSTEADRRLGELGSDDANGVKGPFGALASLRRH